MPHHWEIEPVSDRFSVNSNTSMHPPQDPAPPVHDSARSPLAALNAQEPVETGPEENDDSRQTFHTDLPCKAQTAEHILQGTWISRG